MSQEDVDFSTAQRIMGEDFISSEAVTEEIARRHNGPLLGNSRIEFKRILIGEKELETYKGSFILIPGYELSIMDFFSMATYDLDIEIEDAWYVGLPFAQDEKVDPCWYLVRKGIIPGSAGETFTQWEKRLRPGEEIPRACELFYTVIFFNIFTGARLYRKSRAFCKDIVSDGFNPQVGIFPPGGQVGIRCYRNDDHLVPQVGLVPIRKLF